MRGNPERKRQIADAAIEILAKSGARGLSHRAVDVEAGLPPGTTSNYYNSRHSLLVAAGQRLSELHWRYVHALSDETGGRLDRERLGAILLRIVRAEEPEVRVRHLARYELFLAGAREPQLQPMLVDLRNAAMKTAELLLQTAGLPAAGHRVSVLASMLNGLTFDHLTAPPGPLSQTGPGSITVRELLDSMFGAVRPVV